MEFIPADYFRKCAHREIFPDPARSLEIDVGSGDGALLLGLAKQFPERDFLGIERLLGRVTKVCRKAARAGLTNLRVLRLESAYTLGWLLPDSCAARVHLLFPDPWPKKKHARHRFVNEENVAAIHRVLREEGEFLFKTDHPDYFEEACAVVDGSPLFTRLRWLPPEEFYPQTDFELQWLTEGKSIQAARWQRVG